MNRRGQHSIQANPMLIGAATVLIVLVGVFLAYNANSGLPLVPSYKLTVEVPDAARMNKGNEVRLLGRRVGVVERITARAKPDGSTYARVAVKLDKAAGPLAADTTARVRPRSTLGAKYLELTPGDARRTIPDGGTLPLKQSKPVVEIDQALAMFDAETRRGLRGTLIGVSDGLAGRGQDFNQALVALEPLLGRLSPVARNLADPDTGLREAIGGLTSAMQAIAPVSDELNGVLRGAVTTFEAVDEAEPDLVEALEIAPETATASARSLRAIRPVLTDAAQLAVDLRPGARLLPGALDGVADLSRQGAPVLDRAVDLGPQLQETLESVGRLTDEPATSGAVVGLTKVVGSLEPTLRELTPFQVQCNYLGLWTRNASSTISEGDALGTWFRFTPVLRPAEFLQRAKPAQDLHVNPYGSFDGECETGNEPYLPGTRIGSVPGKQANRTEATAPPKAVGR